MEKESITCENLIGLSLICSRQSIQKIEWTIFVKWFAGKLDQINIIATISLVYNAAIMVQQGIGYMITIDNLAKTFVNPNLCFLPSLPL